MKPGDVVKVKQSGRDQKKDTYGIYLGREKGEKVHLFSIFTGEKVLKFRRKSVQPVGGIKSFQGRFDDQKLMKSFLRDISAKLKKKGAGETTRLLMTPQEIERQVSIRDLWISVVRWVSKQQENVVVDDDVDDAEDEWGFLLPRPSRNSNYLFSDPVDIQTIAGIHFYPKELSKGQVKAVGDILEPCRKPGMPYFSKGTRSTNFTTYSPDAIQKAEDHIRLLNDFKGRFVEWVHEGEGEEDEGMDNHENDTTSGGGSGRGHGGKDGGKGRGGRGSRRGKDRHVHKKRRMPKRILEDPSKVELEPQERETLDQLVYWGKDYFKEGGWDKLHGFGLGGTPITRIDKFSLPRFLDFLGWDLAGERILETPSALLEFMLRLGRISWREASELMLIFKITSGEVQFFLDFPRSVLGEASTLPDEPDPEDFQGRMDLRDRECYTIDPPDAKDFDDAVGFRDFTDSVDGRRKVELFVHIADVTHYVKPDYPMDDDARRRCTSVYLPTGVLPMLPRELSENLCSLRGGVDRLAFSTRMIFDAENADLLEWEHFKSVVRVKENLSYDHVNEQIEKDPDSLFAAMVAFSVKLKEREERLNIVTKERKIKFPMVEEEMREKGGKGKEEQMKEEEDVMDDDTIHSKEEKGKRRVGEELEVSLKSPSPATEMIEQFMVITNEAVARTIHEAGIPSVYRIHPLPDRPDVEKWNGMCEALGFEDAMLIIDFDSLNRSASFGGPGTNDGGKEKGKGRGKGSIRGAMKPDDIISMLQSGGTLTLGGFGGATPKRDNDKTRSEEEEVNEITGESEDEREGDEGGYRGGKREGEYRGEKREGENKGEEREGENKGEEREGGGKEDGAKIREALVPMDPEDLRVVGGGYRKALKSISEMDDERIRGLLYQRFLSTLPRAVYSVNNHGHFGLNSLCYTHFTSPIRRYPDVLVHRILADLVEGKEFDEEEKALLKDDLEIMVDICNDQSKAAEDMERDMIDVALATRASLDLDYRRGTHECTISGLTPTSCFLSIDGATEGRIPLSRISKQRLTLDESQCRILLDQIDGGMEHGGGAVGGRREGSGGKRGDGNKRVREHGSNALRGVGGEAMANGEIELYRLGQTVKCRIHSVKLSEGKVDLTLAK